MSVSKTGRMGALVVPMQHTIDIAETAGLALLGVMKSAGPIDGDVALLTVEAGSALHRTTSADATELKQAIKNRAIVANVVLSLLALIGLHVVGRHPPEKFDVLVGVELGHLIDDCRLRSLQRNAGISRQFAWCTSYQYASRNVKSWAQHSSKWAYIDLEILVDIVVHHQAVCQSNPVGLHRMASNICIVANIRVIEVGNLLLGGGKLCIERTITADAGRVHIHVGDGEVRRVVEDAAQRLGKYVCK